MRTIIVTMLFVLAAAGAAEARGLQGGEIRLGVATNLYQTATTDFEDTDFEIETDLVAFGGNALGFVGGYAIDQHLEAGAILSYVDVDDGPNNTLLGGYFDYNVPVGTSSLYGEGALLYQSSEDTTQFGLAIGGGIKVFVADGASLDVGLKAFWLTGEVDAQPSDVDIETTGFLIHLGVSAWIGGGGSGAR